MKNIFKGVNVAILLFAFAPARSQSEWELKKSESGINVYTRYTPTSQLKEVLVKNTVKSSLSAIVALLLDTKNYPNWIYACKEEKTLKVVSDKEQYQYQVVKIPWPFSNRDLVIDFKISQDSLTKVVTIASTCSPDFTSHQLGCIRVEHFQSTYTLTPVPGGNVQVEFEMFVDPGGSIPDWLINDNIVRAPYNTTVGMIDELPNYQSSSVPFIKDK
jgi:hypothetical protein